MKLPLLSAVNPPSVFTLTMRGLTLLLAFFGGHEVSALSTQTVTKELGPDLSKAASITGGGSPKYTRWSEYAPPSPGVIVNVASEDDVAATVSFNSPLLDFRHLLIANTAIGKILHFE